MDSNHNVSWKVYLNVISVLLVLTVATVLVSLVDFGMFNLLIAMGIATAKAALVLMYFMHLKYDDKTYLVIFISGVFFLVLIFAFSMFDVATRIFQPSVL